MLLVDTRETYILILMNIDCKNMSGFGSLLLKSNSFT